MQRVDGWILGWLLNCWEVSSMCERKISLPSPLLMPHVRKVATCRKYYRICRGVTQVNLSEYLTKPSRHASHVPPPPVDQSHVSRPSLGYGWSRRHTPGHDGRRCKWLKFVVSCDAGIHRSGKETPLPLVLAHRAVHVRTKKMQLAHPVACLNT